MTGAQLLELVRDYLGEDSPGNWTDAMLYRAINRSAKEVYNQIVMLNEDFFGTSSFINLTSGTQLYALPTTQKILLVEETRGSDKYTLRKIPMRRKNEFQTRAPAVDGQRLACYFVLGANIGFAPIPRETVTGSATAGITIYTVPALTTIDDAADTLPSDWTDQQHEVVVMGAVIRAVMRNKELIKVYQPNFDRLWKGMIDDMQNRDSSDTKTITPDRDGWDD